MAGNPIGATLGGKYRIVRAIGEGGMGSVFEGENQRIGRRVAIKLIAPDLQSNKEIVARFRREATVTSRIVSEHIVQILDVEEDDNHGLYLVMELLRGEDLGDRLKRERNLPLETSLVVAYHTAMALEAAHAAHVVHRDLKPANIFLHELADDTTIVKVVDFGISKLVEDQGRQDTALTRVGTIVGTLQYMSPEQAQGEGVDHRSDIWSLGCVFYELLAGRPAYTQAKTLEEAYRNLMKGRPPLLGQIAQWVPPKLVELVEDCMSRKLEKRVADGATFMARLQELYPHLDLAENMRAPPPPESMPPMAGDPTIVSSAEEIAEIRRSSRGKAREATTAARAKTAVAKRSARPADSDIVTLARKAPVIEVVNDGPPSNRAGELSEDEMSMVARPSDIRELRRMLIEKEMHDLDLYVPSTRPPTSVWRWVLLGIAVVLIAFALGGSIALLVRRTTGHP